MFNQMVKKSNLPGVTACPGAVPGSHRREFMLTDGVRAQGDGRQREQDACSVSASPELPLLQAYRANSPFSGSSWAFSYCLRSSENARLG